MDKLIKQIDAVITQLSMSPKYFSSNEVAGLFKILKQEIQNPQSNKQTEAYAAPSMLDKNEYVVFSKKDNKTLGVITSEQYNELTNNGKQQFFKYTV